MSDAAPPPTDPAAAAGGEGAPPAEEKPKRGKPKDPNAPPKPKNAFQRVTGEARKRLKEEKPELATDLKAMGLALKDEWDKVPQEEKDRLTAEYEQEMEVWRPLWAAYKETDGYKEFFEIKQDWIDARMKKKLCKKFAKEAPKRPKSGYMIYAGEIRERVAAEVAAAGGGMGDIGKKISEEWAALSEAKKAEYGEQSARQKEAFDIEYAKYKLTDSFKNFCEEKAKLDSKQQQKKLIRTKLRDAPKKPPGAFAIYRSEVMADVVKANKGLKSGDLAKKVGEMWKAVPDEKKAEYQKQAEVFKAEHEKKVMEFRKNSSYTNFLKERMKVKLRENKLVNLFDAPKKPKSVFALYSEKHKTEVPKGKGEGKGTTALKVKFSEAAEEEKKALEEQAKSLKEKYVEEVKAFKESDKYKLYEKTDKAIQRELSAAAMKVMTVKFLNAAPPAPPKSPFAVFVGEKRKASGASEGERKSKEAKREEVVAFTKEWEKLDKPSKSAYESTYKDKLKDWEGEVKTFMAQDIWKEYLAEAKEFKVPVKNLLAQKSAALKQLSGGGGMPERPEAMPIRPPDAYRVFCTEKSSEVEGNSEKLLKMWEGMSVEDKSKFFTEASKLEDEYTKQMAEFKKTDEGKNYFRDVSRILRVRKVKRARTLYLKDMPKPPQSALKTFMVKTMAELKKSSPLAKGFELKKMAEERWKNMDPAERAKLEEEGQAVLQAFKDKMNEFKKTTEFTKFTRARLTSAPPTKPAGAPLKPMSALRAYMKEMKGLGKKREELEKDFAELPEAEKAERVQKAKELEKAYSEEIAAFRKSPEWKAYQKLQALHSKRTNLTLAKSKYCTDAPKKPVAAIMLYMAEKRRDIMRENPDLKGPAILSKASEMWNALSAEDKAPWVQRETEAKAVYNEKLAEYKQSENFQQYLKVAKRYERRPKAKAKAKAGGKGKGKGSKMSAAGPKPPPEPANMPKRPPVSAMSLFMKDSPGMNLKTAGEAWTKLGAEGQKKYVDQLKELQAEYDKEFKEFQKSAEGKKYLRLKNAFEKRSRADKVKAKFLGGENAVKEPKRPQSAYFIFVSEKRESVAKDLGSSKMGDVAKKLTELWGSLTPEDKKVYEDKAKELKVEYEKAMEEYKSSAGYKAYNRALQSINKKPKGARKAAPKPKAKVKAVKAKAKPKARGARASPAPGGAGAGRGRGRGRGAPGRGAPAAEAADSDSDAMGSDSSSSSSSDDSD